MEEELELVFPSEEYKEEIIEFKEEFIKNKENKATLTIAYILDNFYRF